MQGQDNIELRTVLNVFLRVFAHSHSMKRRHSTRRVSFACEEGNCWWWLWSGWCCWCCRIWSGMCQVVAAATPTSNWCRVHWGHCRQATHLGGAFGCLRFAKERDIIECGCAAVCCRYQGTVSMWRVWHVSRWRQKCVSAVHQQVAQTKPLQCTYQERSIGANNEWEMDHKSLTILHWTSLGALYN